MDIQSYKRKLELFNSTEKYNNEVAFLKQLLGDLSSSSVLDYGCGNCYTMKRLTAFKIMGYDKHNYANDPLQLSVINRKFECAYMLHSIAHIEDIAQVLVDLRDKIRTSLTIITPNRLFLEANPKPNYIPDPTVIKHYSLDELIYLLKSTGWFIGVNGQFGDYSKGYNERIFLQANKV